MKITVTFDVESRDALNQILLSGRDYSLYDYKLDNFIYGITLDTLTAKAEMLDEATEALFQVNSVLGDLVGQYDLGGYCGLVTEAFKTVSKAKELK